MALPVGVTSALAHIDAPVSFGGTPAKVYLEIVPNIRLNHIATGTPLADFIDVRTPGLGDPATVTLPHTDQTGFQDESGLPVVNWSYAATIRYELDGQLLHVPVKHFQILTGQTDVDLALIPVGEPAEIIMGNVAFVSSVNGVSGPVTLDWKSLGPLIELADTVNLDSLIVTGDYVQSTNAAATGALGYPLPYASMVQVRALGTHVWQKVTTYQAALPGVVENIRAQYLGTWGGWTQNAGFVDPGADRICFWDDSSSTFQPLTHSSPLVITGTTLTVSAATESLSGRVELATAAETATGTDITRAVHPAGLKPLLDAKNGLTGLGYRSHASTDDPTTYPFGVSNFLAGTGDGWSWSDSETFKNVITFRQTFGTGTGGTFQMATPYLDNSRPPQFRTWDADDVAWGPWYVFASRPYVDAAVAPLAPLASPTFTGTVSGITKTMVGLGNVDNTADTAKPVSTATTTQLNLKAPIASPTFTGTVSGITKSMVGLGSVDNTADTAKPISTLQQAALDLKAPIASPTFTGTVSGVSKAMVGLGNVDNTSDLGAAISTATQAALDLKMPLNHTINTRTATPYNMVAADDLVVANLGTAITISLPDPTTVAVGREYQLKNIGAGTLTVNSQGTTKTLDGTASQTLAQWAKATYYSNGTNWFTI